MFTGLVEEIGKVKNIQRSANFGRIEIEASIVLVESKIGDSIAVNGVCLTAVEFSKHSFVAEAMKETLDKTSLGFLKSQDSANLERALLPTTRLGGHFVSGHIDGLGRVEEIRFEGPAKIFKFSASTLLLNQMVSKGSIAIDGVSLTLIDVGTSHFSVGIIPHTQSASTLSGLSIGMQVNLETDILAKYCQKMLGNTGEKGIASLGDLAKLGF